MNTNNPVKVLAVVAQLNRGGLETRLMDILRKMNYEKVQIDIFTYSKTEGVYDEEAKKLGSTIYYNKPLKIGNMLKYIFLFKKFLEEHPEYKIIHAYQDAWSSVFCKGAYLAGVPIRIAHSRTAISTLTIKNICKNIIKMPCRKYATHYFAVSKKAGIWLFGKKNTDKGKVEIWKNAIDVKKFRYNTAERDKIRDELGLTEKDFVIMHVGNFTRPKNHPFIIDVFEEVLKKNKNAYLVLVGADTPVEHNMNAIKEKVRSKELNGRVFFLGNRSDVSSLLQGADLFLFPSLFEGFPGAVLEAQSSGLPCVISDSITEEVQLLETTIMISLNTTAEEWAKSVCSYAEYERKDTVERIVEQGYDINTLVNKLTQFYESEEVKYESL